LGDRKGARGDWNKIAAFAQEVYGRSEYDVAKYIIELREMVISFDIET